MSVSHGNDHAEPGSHFLLGARKAWIVQLLPGGPGRGGRASGLRWAACPHSLFPPVNSFDPHSGLMSWAAPQQKQQPGEEVTSLRSLNGLVNAGLGAGSSSLQVKAFLRL